VSVAIANVVVPLIIAREYPETRRHLMTGVYAAMMNVGTMTVTFATAPISVVGSRGCGGYMAHVVGWLPRHAALPADPRLLPAAKAFTYRQAHKPGTRHYRHGRNGGFDKTLQHLRCLDGR